MRRCLRPGLCAALSLLALVAGARAAPAAKLVGPFAKDEYPQAVIDRPLTLPAGMVEGEVGFDFVSQRLRTPILGIVGGADDWLADVTLRVGITDRVQLDVGTAFSLDHKLRDVGPTFNVGRSGVDTRPSLTSWQRTVPVRLSLLALDTEALDTALTVTVPFVAHAERTFEHFLGRSGADRVTIANSDGRVVPVVQLAAPTRWRLNDWLWLRGGQNLFDVTTGNGTAAFAFDVGVGVQPHPLFAVTLDTRVATITFDGSGHEDSTTLADDGLVDLQGIFSPCPYFDVVGEMFAPDAGDGLRNYVTRVAVRLRF